MVCSMKRPAALAPTASAALTRAPAESVAAARGYLVASRADATRRAYASDRAVFARWCAARGVDPLPASPATVALYATDLADGAVEAGRPHQWGRPRAPATVARHLVSIGLAHRAAGHPSPAESDEVRGVLEGIRRARGTRPNAKRAAVLDTIRAMVAAIGGDAPRDVRDRAIILLGFWTACRRSELVALDRADVRVEPAAVRVLLRRSKTDQEGAGRWVAAPAAGDASLCPVAAVRAWDAYLRRRGVEGGPLFVALSFAGFKEPLSGAVVADAVKRAVERAGLDAAAFGGHSLRSGFVTTAGQTGVPLAKIAQKTGHRRLDTLRAYLHDVEGVEHDAGFGLA
jgi:site-specific recombinase XerD